MFYNIQKIAYSLSICIYFFPSCASIKPEKEAYYDILKMREKHYYSKAVSQVFKFEAAYPDSKYLCELWEIQVNYYTKRKKNFGYIKKLKKKRCQRCVN